MGFWGIEVKPGKPYPYHADNVQGKLHVTQATLGTGSSTEKSILQCGSGHKSPVFLCSLLPNKIESCPLNLQFDDDDLVAFSVIGSRSIHLSGYFVADDGDDLRDDYEYDSLGEDAVGTDSEESSEYDSEDGYADDFIDDSDNDLYPSSPVPNSGVIIEEIPDDDELENGDGPTKQLEKREQLAHLKEKDSKSSQLPVVVRGETGIVLESEDEDGFPISTTEKGKSESQKAEAETKREQAHKKAEKANKKAKDVDHSASLKRKVESADEDEQLQDGKKKKKNKLKENGKEEITPASGNGKETNVTTPDEKHPEEVKTTTNLNNASYAEDGHDGKLSNNEVPVEKKTRRKRPKNLKEKAAANQISITAENQNVSSSKKKGKEQTEAKPSQVRTFPNGLVIEEVFMGKPDGKRAAPGKKVSVKYIGKLKKDGKLFDSNVGRIPFKFRLGQVIKGWEVGVNGMRVGDKRRITIPPSMGIPTPDSVKKKKKKSSDDEEVEDSAAAVVRNFYGGINAHDVDSVQYLIAENCVYEDLVFPRPFLGRKEILEFFKKFTDSTSKDLQFVIDDLSSEDSSSVGVTWHLEWKGKPFPFSKGCSFYRLEVINGKRDK